VSGEFAKQVGRKKEVSQTSVVGMFMSTPVVKDTAVEKPAQEVKEAEKVDLDIRYNIVIGADVLDRTRMDGEDEEFGKEFSPGRMGADPISMDTDVVSMSFFVWRFFV
jgi:hypothetical protein